MAKYELVKEDSIVHKGHTLYRIRCLWKRGLSNSAEYGKLGGYVESEKNLSQKGKCWIEDDAKVYGNAVVDGDATLFMNAEAYDNAIVTGSAFISQNSKIYENAKVFGGTMYKDSQIYGNAKMFFGVTLSGKSQVFGDAELGNSKSYTTSIKVDDNAKVCGTASLQGKVTVKGDAVLSLGVITSGTFDGSENPRKQIPANKKLEQEIDNELDDLWNRREYQNK
jgi:carbonic anhydrase/acetyltransferase-like protein (isoleucine patch superfamily)